MPLLKITTSVPPAPAHSSLLTALSSQVAELLGKPESYMMTAIDHPAKMTFGGTTAPAAFVELKNVGSFRPENTKKLSQHLCEQLSTGLGVPQKRIYIEFHDSDGYLWGYNGDTFS